MSHRPYRRSYAILAAFIIGVAFVFVTASSAQEEPANPGQQAVELFEQAQDAHAKGDYQKAIELYDKALGVIPEFPEAEYQKGNAFASLKKPVEAEAAYRRAIAMREDWTLPVVALGTLLERRGEYVESEKLLNKAIGLDATSFPAVSALTELRLQTKAPVNVLTSLLAQVRIFASKANAGPPAFTTQASLENAIGDHAAAKKSLERALDIDPRYKQALYLKANIALTENDLVLADAVTRSIEQADKGTEDALVLRARVLLASGKPDDARTLLSSITSPSPAAKALLETANLAAERSPDALEKLLVNDPKNPVILGRLCSIYRLKDAAQALDYCRRALDVQPTDIEPAIGYGAALVQARRFDEAVTIFRRLVGVAPENSTIHANLATALFELKRYQEAKVEYQWLTAKDAVPPIAYYFLALCHDQLGEYLDAGANYELFLKNADPVLNKDEIDKVKFRMPAVEKEIKRLGERSKNKSGR
jgi:tetratricopeptide (TPR) repeat protein